MPTNQKTPARTVFCGDALAWLREQPSFDGCSFVTSLPDISEVTHLPLQKWKTWFSETAATLMKLCPPDGVSIFYQTDVKKEGTWVDKSQLCQMGAEMAGVRLLWHKIVCRQPVGTITYGNPAYSHMLAFSRKLRLEYANSSADVLQTAGASLWTRGMGVEACKVACHFILHDTATRTVVDPFCGRGTVLAVANALGLDAIGVELNRRRAAQSRTLTVERIRKATET